MRYYIGIDPSLTCTAVAVFNDMGFVATHRVIVKPRGKSVRNRISRCDMIASKVFGLLRPMRVSTICLEGYSYGSRNGGEFLGELGGILRRRLMLLDRAPILEVAPTTLKKFITGKGSGKKTAVIARIASEFGHTFDTDDEFDAFGLGLMAKFIGTLEVPSIKPRIEAIAKVKEQLRSESDDWQS